MRDLLLGSFALPRRPLWRRNSISVIDWNIDRGLRLPEIVSFLDAQKADVILLQEVDLYARRTGYRNIAEEIARQLKMNYVFGCEFQELSQGRRGAPAYQGQVTLSCWPLENPRVIHFRRQSSFWKPKWFLPRTEPFQQRLGGRIALITELKMCGHRVVIYNLHLESRGDTPLKLAQLSETLDDTKHYIESHPILLAGDLNVDLGQGSCSAAVLGRLGFHSAIALPTRQTTTPRGLFRHRRTIDWVYLAGPIQARSGRVYDDTRASDHYPLLFEIQFTET
jgi:endonuclease/exonuclease/phosphatase family metal-dependent hydrolase